MFPSQPQPSQPSTPPTPQPGSGLPPVLSHSGPVVPIDPNPSQLVPSATPMTTGSAPEFQENAIPSANTDLSIDYLNQIAPQQQKTVNRFAVFGLISGMLVVVLVLFMVITNSGPPDISSQTKSLQQRIATLQSVVDSQQPHLQNNGLSAANSTLSSTLTSMSTDLATLMKAKGVKASDSTTSIATSEKKYASTLRKKLDDSYQRGTLDRVYAPQMTYELTVLRTKIKLLKSTNGNSKSVDEFCTTSLANVDAILKTYATDTSPTE
jgi:hypothetical protein